jgi:hypothetical protein
MMSNKVFFSNAEFEPPDDAKLGVCKTYFEPGVEKHFSSKVEKGISRQTWLVFGASLVYGAPISAITM